MVKMQIRNLKRNQYNNLEKFYRVHELFFAFYTIKHESYNELINLE